MSSSIFKNPLPYLALVLTHFIWGANFVVAKLTLEEFPVMTLGFLRFLLAFILILPFLAVFEKKQLSLKPQHYFKLIIAGMFSVSLSITFFLLGIERTSAINASSLTMSIPILSLLISWIVLKEKIYLVNFLGIIFGLAGALVILGFPLIFIDGLSGSNLIGNILILLSALSSIVGLILIKQLLKIYHPLVITAVFFLIGTVSFMVPAIIEYISSPGWIYNVSILGIFGLLYMGVMASVVAYFLYSWSLEKVDVVKVALFEYMNPAVTASLAVPLLGERISFSFIIGTSLVVLGVYWGTLGKTEHHQFHHKHQRS